MKKIARYVLMLDIPIPSYRVVEYALSYDECSERYVRGSEM